MSAALPRLRAWEVAFDLAVEVFRITARLPEGGACGIGARMRGTAIRVPCLITRAAAGPAGSERGWELQGALDGLADLLVQIRARQALMCTEPGEVRRITQLIDACRREVERLAPLAGPDHDIPCLARNSLNVVGDDPPG